MEITRRTDYAIRVLMELSNRPEGTRLTARRLAELEDVPYAFARSVVTQLAGAGMLESRRGAEGGVALALPPAEITILDIIRAIEGPTSLSPCTQDLDWCARRKTCAVHKVWVDADLVLREFLASRDLASLVG